MELLTEAREISEFYKCFVHAKAAYLLLRKEMSTEERYLLCECASA